MSVNGEDKTRAKVVNPVLPEKDRVLAQLPLRALPREDAEDCGSKSFIPSLQHMLRRRNYFLTSVCYFMRSDALDYKGTAVSPYPRFCFLGFWLTTINQGPKILNKKFHE